MSIRLVREFSETPNIQNKDDAKMIRYAYGGYDGVVKGFGQECAYTFENGIFKIGSGRIVLQGWEVDIDEFGWSLDLSNVTTGEYYYVVYLEVNLVTQQANINYNYDLLVYPGIDRGDDLTTYPNGIASLVLYSFRLSGGKIFLVNEEIPKIKYLKDCVSDFGDSIDSLGDSIDSLKLAYKSGKLAVKYAKYAFGGDDSKGTIEERLTKLGFKSGVITFAGESYGSVEYQNTENNGIYRQGNYVFCRIKIENKPIKLQENIFGVIPETFRPKKETYFTICATSDNFNYGGLLCRVDSSGYVAQINSFGAVNDWIAFGLNNTYIEFGYEAQPIE